MREVEVLAAGKGCTPAQIALAWLFAQGDDVVPIPGTKRIRFLEQNIGALDVALSSGDLATLESVFHPQAPSGKRYADMSFVNR